MAKEVAKEETRGGYREGSGRKLEGDEPKVIKSYTVPVEVSAYLVSTGNASKAVAEAVKRSKGFKDWKAAQKADEK